MAFISRPGKEGNATTYQGKVAAGYTTILAQEVDADFDAIYSAWNAGVDTVNIKDQAVTAAKLAPGAVGASALAPGSITNAALAVGAVTSATILDGTITGADIQNGTIDASKIASVAWTQLIAPHTGAIPITPKAQLITTPNALDIQVNVPGVDQYDNTLPSWLIVADCGNDAWTVYRAPPPGTTFVPFLNVGGSGIVTCNLAALSVLRNHLAVNAPNGTPVSVPVPASFSSSATGWTTLATLPALTTRGGLVHLWAAACLSVVGISAGGNCYTRWLCDAAPVIQNVQMVSSTARVPVPDLHWVDNPQAGTHTYAYQVAIDPTMTISTSPVGGGYLRAVEIG